MCATIGIGSLAAAPSAHDPAGLEPNTGNPIIPGYYADPSIVQYQGRNYIYATLDPWGGETLGCWSSSGFSDWTFHRLNWPTKAACTSPTSHRNMVWAPSVIQAPGGGFVMYVSVGSEIWVGKAPHPLGPWTNALGDRPLIPANFRPGFHMIDAEVFLDDDGHAYLYWGSGWDWVNGRCFAVRLKPDLVSFDGEPMDVTPANYFEAPFMVKHGGRYYLMYSQGKTLNDTYRVHYATGESPLGPFTEAANSPVLTSNLEANILGPGHHTVFSQGSDYYILYHRHTIPFNPDFIGRQLCIDPLRFNAEGLIEKIRPTHNGPAILRPSAPAPAAISSGDKVVSSASSSKDEFTGPTRVLDQNNASLWRPESSDARPWLRLDLGSILDISRQFIRFEYAWKDYYFRCESSLDGQTWTLLANHSVAPANGSPVLLDSPVRARYLRLVFTRHEADPAVVGWRVE